MLVCFFVCLKGGTSRPAALKWNTSALALRNRRCGQSQTVLGLGRPPFWGEASTPPGRFFNGWNLGIPRYRTPLEEGCIIFQVEIIFRFDGVEERGLFPWKMRFPSIIFFRDWDVKIIRVGGTGLECHGLPFFGWKLRVPKSGLKLENLLVAVIFLGFAWETSIFVWLWIILKTSLSGCFHLIHGHRNGFINIAGSVSMWHRSPRLWRSSGVLILPTWRGPRHGSFSWTAWMMVGQLEVFYIVFRWSSSVFQQILEHHQKKTSNITEGYKWINTISGKGAWIVTKWACEVWTGSKFWELPFAELCFPVTFWCFILVTFRAQKVASVHFFRRGLIAINLPNGAHHSELSHSIQDDTPDVKEAHERILGLVGQWLEEIRNPGGLTIVSWC